MSMKLLAAFLTASLLCASAVAADAPAAPKKPNLAEGEAFFRDAKDKVSEKKICFACHGETGTSVVPLQPNLAQQHPEYLFKQLQEFKSGARQDPVMAVQVTALSEDDMRNIAWWVGSQKVALGPTEADAKQVTLGEHIYRGGIADRRIPACAGCHGPSGAGIPAQYPRLAGQHAEYTVKQLTAFRDQTRTNNPHMADVAAKLKDQEIKAVADYIAVLR
jgi:cytochrome c553